METPGKLTPMQRYHLALIWYFRIFGSVFAVGTVFIVVSNFMVPDRLTTGDRVELVIMGVIFFAVGCAIYLAATRVLRWYRRKLS